MQALINVHCRLVYRNNYITDIICHLILWFFFITKKYYLDYFALFFLIMQKLRLAVTSNEWVWSSPFLLDSEGVQEITVTQSDGKQVLLYVEVIRMGGAQTKV